MKVLNSGPSQPQLRNRAVPALTVALAALIAVVGAVFADAPDPKPEQASVRVGDVFIVNGVQVARVSVSGGWQWPTHHSDCNTNRTGAGYAIDWGDPNQSGNHVTTLDSIGSIDVGAASANAYNPADNEVHPTRPEEAGSLFNDPGQPAQYAQWRGGCGTYNGQFNTGVWGAVDLGSGQPVNCTSANSPSPTCLGGSHVYTLAALQAGVTICTIMYDVHGQDSNAGGAPNGAKEVTGGGSGHNGDNGAEKNGSTPLGNTCAPIPVPTPSSSPTPSPTPSGTPPQTATPTPPQTATPTPPQTATPTPPQTATPTPPQTATPTPPQTPTPTPSGTPTIHDLRCPVGTSRLIIQGTFDATYTDGTFVVSVNFRSSGQLEDFNSNLGVQELLVDGNGGTNRYQFNPPITFGSNFSEPTHGSINQTAFCYVRPGQTPTPTPPQTATPTPPQTPTPTPPQTPSPTPGQNASISGNVCLANNAFTNCPANGPISGVIIQLFNANTAQLVAQTGTDGNGHYVISNIPAGSYYLHEVQPAGPLDQGGCFPGNAGGFCTPVDLILGINLGSGVNATGYNFSEIPGTPVSPTPTPPVTPSPTPPGTATPPPSTPPPTPTASPTPGQGTLTGCVYVANDAVTVFPGNGPISGVTIHLLQSGNLNVAASTVTGANGCYTFTNIPTGSYIIREFQPGGYNQGGIFPCNAGGVAAPVDLILGVNVSGGSNSTGCNFSEILPGPTPTPTNPCTCATPTPTASPTPSPTPTAPPTASPTPTAPPTASPTPSPSPCSCQTPQPNGSISGHVYSAGNAITVFPGNGPIGGVTIELHRSSDGLLLALVQTDGNGNYTLPNIAAGSYFLHEVQPNGYSQGGIFPGNAGGSASSVDLILGVSLGAGINASNYNFSEIPNGGSTPTPSPTPANPTPTPSATPNTTTCLTNRPDLTMVEISNSALVSLLVNGNGVFGDGTVSINVNSFNGHTFNWSSNIGISSVFARTATGGALFEYNPTVVAANGIGTTTSITFLSFCYKVGNGPTPTPTAPNNPTPTPTLPDTMVAPATAASASTGGALLAGALIVVLAAALALGSGWRRNRRTVKAVVKPMWSTGSRN